MMTVGLYYLSDFCATPLHWVHEEKGPHAINVRDGIYIGGMMSQQSIGTPGHIQQEMRMECTRGVHPAHQTVRWHYFQYHSHTRQLTAC